MKSIKIDDLVKSCDGSMRKIIQLDDLIENLCVKSIVSNKEFEKIQEEFYCCIQEIYGLSFLNNFFDICNSPNYLEAL